MFNGLVRVRWLKGYFAIYLIIIIKLELSTVPIVVIFSVIVCLWWLYNFILSSVAYITRGARNLLPLLMCHLWYWQKIRNILVHFLRIASSHYDNYSETIDGTELLKCLWWICCRVCVEYWANSLNFIQYMGLCVTSLNNFLVMILTMWILLLSSSNWQYFHVWILNHCLGLGHETMVRDVCLIMYLGGVSKRLMSS